MPLRALRHVSPPVLLIASFAALVAGGTLLLALPLAARGERVALIDALFTATSAVCVTGLAVFDVGTRLSGFGQAVLLALIQVGGLGLMTYAVFFTLLLGRSISFRDRFLIQDTLHHSPARGLRRLVLYILWFTALAEGIGALLLWLYWRGEFGGARAAVLAVFHSVSAFCNAGFSLFEGNLASYRGDLYVNLVVSGLIVLGGLGFLVNLELRDAVILPLTRRRARPLSLHTRLVVVTSAGLVVAAMAAILLLEWDNLLRGLPLREKALAAYFAAVTPRTAGFNTLDYGRATAATLFLTILLMFVGGSPGSTAGGVKTTSLAILLALVRARWAGRERVMAFRRTIPDAVVGRALALALLCWALTSGALLLLLISERGGTAFEVDRPPFLALMFETVSAFGTVGLSTGITPELSPLGKLLITLLMFAGRVGPLTIALAAGRHRAPGEYAYAEENVMVG